MSHMNTSTLYSVSEAAKLIGVSRKTVQRWLSSGQLQHHGANQRGRHSKTIDLEEAKAVNQTLVGGADRADYKPVVSQLRAFLSNLDGTGKQPRFTPEEVICVYLAAIEGGADIDFMLYCVDRLRDGDGIFIHMVMGDPVLPLLRDPLRSFASERLRKFATAQKVPESGLPDFETLWKRLIDFCLNTQIEVEVAIVFDQDTKVASLELVPKWLSEAPPGLLPVVGGHHSVIGMRAVKDQDKIASAATKIGNSLLTCVATEKNPRLQALLTYRNEDVLIDRYWEQIVEVCDKDSDYVLSDKSDLPVLDIGLKGKRDSDCNVWRGIGFVAGSLGLNKVEARTFLLAWNRMTADAGTANNIQYRDDLWQNADPDETESSDLPAGSTVRAPMKASKSRLPEGPYIQLEALSKVFGVSRQTIHKTVRPRSTSVSQIGAEGKSNQPKPTHIEPEKEDEQKDETEE